VADGKRQGVLDGRHCRHENADPASQDRRAVREFQFPNTVIRGADARKFFPPICSTQHHQGEIENICAEKQLLDSQGIRQNEA
jgi:hypothetical protein